MGGIAILLAVTVAYALLARRLDRFSISAPTVFVLAGLVLGPDGAGLLDLSPDSHVVLTFTEITLAALLFADAATVKLRDVEGDAGVPGRLLSVGLLLTIVAGTLLGLALTPELGWAGAALMAAVLAPTDAALGMAVVTDRAVPVRIRRALNIESGLNDGIATPFVTVFLAALLSDEGIQGGSWVADAALQIGLAILVALVVGGLGGLLLSAASRRGWTSPVSEQLCVLALAALAYVAAVEIGGNGFVSAFATGLIFGAVASRHERAIGFTEDASLFASFLVRVIFGASFVGPVLAGSVDVPAIVYALLSLTVVRMAPVAIALIGKGPREDDRVHGLVRPSRPRLGGVHTPRDRRARRHGIRRDPPVPDSNVDDPAFRDPPRTHRPSPRRRLWRSDACRRPDGARARRPSGATRPQTAVPAANRSGRAGRVARAKPGRSVGQFETEGRS